MIQFFKFFKDIRFKYTLKYFLKFLLIFFSLFIIATLLCLNYKTIFSLVVAIIFLLVFITFFMMFLRVVCYCFLTLKKTDEIFCKNLMPYLLVSGCCGIGKTRFLVYVSYYSAKNNYFENKFDYFLGQAEKIEDLDDCDKKQCFELVKETYKYFENNKQEFIPHLISNVKIFEKDTNLYSYDFNVDLLTQQSKIPQRTSCLISESADYFPNSLIYSQNIVDKKFVSSINETVSKTRHFSECNIFFDEQNLSENLVGIRRVTDKNLRLNKNISVCKPFFLNLRINRLKEKVVNCEKMTEKQLKKYNYLQNLNFSIGFTKLKFFDYGYTEQDKKNVKEDYFVLPNSVPFRYVSRCYELSTKSLDLPINLKMTKSLYKH